MDFHKLLDVYECKACIMSVEYGPDEQYGNIRLVAANDACIEFIEKVLGREYGEDVPYRTIYTRNLNFEYDCFLSAVKHQHKHSYVSLYRMNMYMELYFVPLASDKENVGYCLYTYEVSPMRNANSMTDVAPETSARVLASCIKMHGAKDFTGCMSEVIADIRELCDARRCCILLMDTENRDCTILSDEIRPGVERPKDGESMNKSFYTTAESWEKTLAGSTCLILKNQADLLAIKEINPTWYASLARAQVQSIALFPLKHNGDLVGYIWVSNFDTIDSVKIKEVLELTTFFIASEIANYLLLKKLEQLGSMDLLTGTKNRNAMNNRVDEFDNQIQSGVESLGIVFADLNGLKVVNDKEGHVAGDRLLKNAAAVLNQVFLDEEIYRAGGDEFMIIAVNRSKEDIEEKVQKLRDYCEQEGSVKFAIGVCYDDKDINIRSDMHIADERMYEDKKEYYRKYPERKYR